MAETLVLAVAGTAASGKTTVAEKLAVGLGARLIDLKSYALENNLVVEADSERDTLVVDEDKLREKLIEELRDSRQNVVVEGILAPYAPATHMLVLRCSPRKLAERMKKRGYGRSKIMENLEAELLGVCLQDSLWCENVFEVDATDGVDLKEILAWAEHGGRNIKRTDWFSDYEKLLAEGF